MNLKTPIAFFIFNRPNTTEKVFEAIRQAKPSKLLVVADGPRCDRIGEAEKCLAARVIINSVDWECEILTNYSDVNLGCKHRVSSGLDWVFEKVEEAIILEDDCIPHATFFQFCEELLDRFREDERIMAISGDNFQFGRRYTNDSYYFSRYFHCWGWASWQRAWQNYDVEIRHWPTIRDHHWVQNWSLDFNTAKYWTHIFQSTYEGTINTWDYQFLFACWIQNGLIILPQVNLVTNIGFSEDATNTKKSRSKLANLPVNSIEFPLEHPNFIISNTQADRFTEKYIYNINIFLVIKNKIISYLKILDRLYKLK
jgi:hypothetical protein